MLILDIQSREIPLDLHLHPHSHNIALMKSNAVMNTLSVYLVSDRRQIHTS